MFWNAQVYWDLLQKDSPTRLALFGDAKSRESKIFEQIIEFMAKSTSKSIVPAEEREMTEQAVGQQSSSSTPAEAFKEKKFDEVFWLEVKNKVDDSDVSWNRAMDEVRAQRLIDDYGKNALFVIIDKWPKMKKYQRKPELLPSLEYLISRLTEIILDRDTKKEYEFYRAEELSSKPTLLHLAAEQNFLHVARCLVNKYYGLVYLKLRDKTAALPVEVALRERKDAAAAYLISQMRYNRVQELFLLDEDDDDDDVDVDVDDDEQPKVKFYFGDIISYRDPKTNEYSMKKTVLAVLDKLINPHWPYLIQHQEEEAEEDIQRALETVPNDPMDYDFYFHILEADDNGRQPRKKIAIEFDEDGEPLTYHFKPKRKFNRKSMSCLRRIADSDNKEAVQHPVVRMLVSRKWNQFAHKWFCVKAVLYLLFLKFLSFALIYGSSREDPMEYTGRADTYRALCEIFTVVFLMIHLFQEIDEISSEGVPYFKEVYNYFDLLGIILTLVVIPLRFAGKKCQWSVAAVGFIFNFLRVFKFCNVTRITGLYTTTLVNIILKDITRFLAFFSVIFFGFCGAMYIALKVDNLQNSFTNFAWLMLAGFRVLVEGQPVAEDYGEAKYGWLVIVILLLYMGVVIVILLNVLIAQLSYTYSEAKKVAKLQYAVDTMRIISRLEYSRFANWNLRVNTYEDGSWLNDEDLAKEILEYAEERHPWETVEDRVTTVREIMRKVVRKGKEKDPMETIEEKLTNITTILKPPEVEKPPEANGDE